MWYNAIRAARYAYLKTAYPTGTDEEVGFTPPIMQDNLETICLTPTLVTLSR